MPLPSFADLQAESEVAPRGGETREDQYIVRGGGQPAER